MPRALARLAGLGDHRRADRREHDDAAVVLGDDDLVEVLVANKYVAQLQPPGLAFLVAHTAPRAKPARQPTGHVYVDVWAQLRLHRRYHPLLVAAHYVHAHAALVRLRGEHDDSPREKGHSVLRADDLDVVGHVAHGLTAGSGRRHARAKRHEVVADS